jgi:hypothetical protein
MSTRRGRGTLVFSLLALVVLLVVVGYGLYLANMAGRLPWQEEPTRIPVTPFADLGGPDDATEAAPGTPVTGVPGWTLGTLGVVERYPQD